MHPVLTIPNFLPILAALESNPMRSMRFTTIMCLLFLSLNVFAQDSTQKANQPPTPDTSAQATANDAAQLLTKLNQVYIMLNRINYTTGNKLNIQDIEKELDEVTGHLHGLKNNLSSDNRTLTIRTLQMYEILLVEMLDDLENWKGDLQDYENKVRSMTAEIDALKKDSTFRRLRQNQDLRAQYGEQLSVGRQKFRAADSTLRLSLAKITSLQTKISEDYIDATESRNKVRKQLRAATSLTFTKEAPYIWEAATKVTDDNIGKNAGRSYTAERSAMQYYFSKRYWNRFFLILTGLVFLTWVFINFRVSKKNQTAPSYAYKFLRPIPITASLIVLFILSPFFDLYAPAVYYQMMQLGLILVLTFSFAQRWPRAIFWNWLGVVALFLVFSFCRTMINPGMWERWLLIMLNITAAGFTAIFLKKLQPRLKDTPFIRPIILTGITLHIAAALFNLFGRVTLAQTLGSTSIFSLTQIVGLSAFMQIMTEAIYLQVVVSRYRNKMYGVVSYEQVAPKFKNLLSFIVIVLWALLFTANLNVYSNIYKYVSHFLTEERQLGSTVFTLGNLFVFLLVLWVSFILQKFTGFFFGIVNHDNNISDNLGRKGNRLLVLRLVIVIIGFLLAIAASGLPIDKLTIIFSALGVGIGLGLQDIVNNFVSGIILIFERPFHIGDTIEISGKLGKVKTISVRSSVIQTDKGAEIIVPNGDLLSQQVINWTLTNRHVLAELRLTLTGNPNFKMVKALILETVKGQQGIIGEKEPQVLIEEITNSELSILIQFWISDINQADEIQSEIKTRIYSAMQKHELQLRVRPVA